MKLFALEFRHILEVFAYEVYEKILGAFSRLMRPKTIMLAMKFRRILEVLCLQVLQKKFLAHYHHLYVQI